MKRFLIATETHEIVRIRGVFDKDGGWRNPAPAKPGETKDQDPANPLPETLGTTSEESRREEDE